MHAQDRSESLDWSDWSDLAAVGEATRGSLSTSSVVYQLRAVDRSGDPVSQRRFLAIDPTGLLYIGRTSKSIGQRMKRLMKGRRSGREMTHTVGRKLHVLDRLTSFGNKFANLTIQFRYAACADPRDCEKELLRDYTATFGETPPLNGEFPDRGNREAWAGHMV